MQHIAYIAIIGAGQLGSRHLQALALMDRPTVLQVVDPSIQALNISRERFGQVQSDAKNILKVEYFSKIDELSDCLDVVVVATNANVRRSVIEELLKSKSVRYLILEKVVFQTSDDFAFVNALFEKEHVKAWVNCPRRMWPVYQRLQEKMQDAQFVDYRATGSQWGLGCNSIHLLDHYAFLTKQTDFALFGDQLDAGFIASKRQGFIEFTGTLLGKAFRGGTIALTSYSLSETPFVIDIATDTFRCSLRELEGKILISEKTTNWKWKEEDFQVPYQSQLTHLAVQQILDTDQCDLPAYHESWKLHIPLLNLFSVHIKKTTMEDSKICPIT